MATDTYGGFASVYDALMYDVDYEGLAVYVKGLAGNDYHRVLDVGCGTGTMLDLLSRGSKAAAGIDISPEIAEEARNKCPDAIIVTGDMREAESYASLPDRGRYDLAVSLFDSLNYLADEEELSAAFRNIFDAMAPGGSFVFDMNSEYKLSTVLGHNFYYDLGDEECYIWDNDYDEERRMCEFDLTFFAREEDGRYRRIDEIHREYAYDADRVAELLQKAGFRDVKIFGDRRCVPPAKNEERIFFAAQKP